MFVNDTGRLPESGRVCVAGFQAEAQPEGRGTRTFYSLEIHAARAEIEPMSEPRNPAHVLGVGCEIQSLKGPVFAAYFAASRERFDAGPNYKSGLFVLVDGAVYAVNAESIGTTIRRGFSTREFTLLRADRPQRKVEYPWPWYKEPFVSSGHVRSQDFLREMSSMVRTYG
jgi:hypothetical protein